MTTPDLALLPRHTAGPALAVAQRIVADANEKARNMQIDPKHVIHWRRLPGGLDAPRVVSIRCGHAGCAQLVSVEFTIDLQDREGGTAVVRGACPSCGGSVQAWAIKGGQDGKPAGIAMWPPPWSKHGLQPWQGLVPEAIWEDYDAAVVLFNDASFPAAVSACRRAIEGVVVDHSPNATGNGLAGKVKSSRGDEWWTSKTQDAASAAAHYGNFGVHRDRDFTPIAEYASAMIELTERFIGWAYVWGALAGRMEEIIRTIATETSSGGEEESA